MFRNAVEQLFGSVCSELAFAQVDDVIASGLHEYLDRLQTRMNELGSDIHETFFEPRLAPPTRRKARAQTVRT